ncbi:DUF3566 domain-containing protein [Geodermatophilus sp. SYSU D00815]
MSDRQGSVRTQDAAGGPGAASVSTTQAIPTTGSQRAQSAAGPATGAPVPPATGASAAVPPGGPGAGAPGAGAPGAAPVAGAPGAGAPGAGAPAGAPAGGAAASAPAKKAGKVGRPAKGAPRGPRRARLQLRNIDIWSAFKISLVLSIALFFIWMVAVGILYGVLSGLGVFDTLNDLFGQLGSASGDGGGSEVITPGIVFGGAAVIGAINVVLMTALCTVGTFIYNLCSDLVGGLELTLSERD